MSRNPIHASVDFSAPGKQHGHLMLPYSRNDSAWGHIMIPITVIANGHGQTALLTGGNHGDEYEGPLALMELAHALEPEQVSGRVIIVPVMNQPAFDVAARVSPADGGNLNRTFPGKPDGTPTQKIADYFQTVLLPMADIVLDFHSGGRTLDFMPFAAIHETGNSEQTARAHAAMQAFGAPWSMVMTELDAVGMYDTAAEAMGKVFVTTELRGGGTANAASVAIARRGIRYLLIHAGIVGGELEVAESRAMVMPDGCFHLAPQAGIFEMCADLGATVETGDLLARIWPRGVTGQAPSLLRANIAGVVAARHFPGLVQAGDCAAVIAQDAAPRAS